jgi:biotin transporter BioY
MNSLMNEQDLKVGRYLIVLFRICWNYCSAEIKLLLWIRITELRELTEVLTFLPFLWSDIIITIIIVIIIIIIKFSVLHWH